LLNTTQQPILQNLKTELPEKNSSKHLGLELKKVMKMILEHIRKNGKTKNGQSSSYG
jgi:hypothetical protein